MRRHLETDLPVTSYMHRAAAYISSTSSRTPGLHTQSNGASLSLSSPSNGHYERAPAYAQGQFIEDRNDLRSTSTSTRATQLRNGQADYSNQLNASHVTRASSCGAQCELRKRSYQCGVESDRCLLGICGRNLMKTGNFERSDKQSSTTPKDTSKLRSNEYERNVRKENGELSAAPIETRPNGSFRQLAQNEQLAISETFKSLKPNALNNLDATELENNLIATPGASKNATSFLERQLKHAREQNVLLSKQFTEAELMYRRQLEESNRKCTEAMRTCETMQLLVASYDAIVTEQTTEIEQLKALLFEESAGLRKPITGKSVETKDNGFAHLQYERTVTLMNATNSVSDFGNDLLRRTSVLRHTAIPYFANKSDFEELRRNYEEQSARCGQLEAEIRKRDGQLRKIAQEMRSMRTNQQRIAQRALAHSSEQPLSVVTVQYSDLLDALTLPGCIVRVFRRVKPTNTASGGKKNLIVSVENFVGHSARSEDFRADRQSASAGTLFSAEFNCLNKLDCKFYCFVQRSSLPLLSHLSRSDEKSLFRMLRASLLVAKHGADPGNYEEVTRRSSRRVLQARTTRVSVIAYSSRSEQERRQTASNRGDEAADGRPLDSAQQNDNNDALQTQNGSESRENVHEDEGICLPGKHNVLTDTIDLPKSTADAAVCCDELDEQFEMNSRKAKRVDRARFLTSDSSYLYEFEDEDDEEEPDELISETKRLLAEFDGVVTLDELIANMLKLQTTEVEDHFKLACARFHFDWLTIKKRAEFCERQQRLAECSLERCLSESNKALNELRNHFLNERTTSRTALPCVSCEFSLKYCSDSQKQFDRLEKCISKFCSRSEQLGAMQEELRTTKVCEGMVACFEALKITHGRLVKVHKEQEYRILLLQRALPAAAAETPSDSPITPEPVVVQNPSFSDNLPHVTNRSKPKNLMRWAKLRDSFNAVNVFSAPKTIEKERRGGNPLLPSNSNSPECIDGSMGLRDGEAITTNYQDTDDPEDLLLDSQLSANHEFEPHKLALAMIFAILCFLYDSVIIS